MTDVEPRFQTNRGPCGCGLETCTAFGLLRRPWRDGTVCVQRGCPCRHCLGKRNKRNGQRAQAKAAKGLGVPRSSISPGHEEFMPGMAVRWEHKHGAQAGPVLTRFRLSRDQSEAQRSIGDHRPFVATFSGGGLQVAVIDLNDLRDVVAAFAEQWGQAS